MAMLSGTVEPEWRHRQRIIPSGNVGAVGGADWTIPSPRAIPTSVDDAPGLHATKVLAHATIHLAVTGAPSPRCELFATARHTTVGARGAIDWANSIAVH